MPDYTPNLNLYLPGGGGSGTIPDEIADIDKLNENFRTIDASLGGGVIPELSGYTPRFNGNIVFARNNRKLYMESLADGGTLDISPGANLHHGTSAERALFTSYATPGDVWIDTDGAQVHYVKRGAEWRCEYGTYYGTAAERALVTSKGRGVRWVDTDGTKQEWSVDPAGAWRIHAGRVTDVAAAWGVSAAPGYGRTLSLTIPTIISLEEDIEFSIVDANGMWIGISPGPVTRNPTNVTAAVYFFRLFNAATSAAVVHWKIVPRGV